VSTALIRAIGHDGQMTKIDERTPVRRVDRAARERLAAALDRDPRLRVRFETRALLDYLDTAPLREVLVGDRRRRLEEGRFGRR